MSIPQSEYTSYIKAEAKRLGFSFCGISKADFLAEEAPLLEKWLSQSMHGEMRYMENHFDKRLDPRKLVEGAKSVISVLYNYFPENEIFTNAEFKISKYAYGKDYHEVIREKLRELLYSIQTQIGEVQGRGFVDSAPVMDKAWAKRAGLGWIGKNANLINKQQGSFFFIANLIIDVELDTDQPLRDYCGTCTRCIDACPTDAIVAPQVVDGSKCISYFTIELKDSIPLNFTDKLDSWIFGCDVCQDVCPWNRFSKAHQEPSFEPNSMLSSMSGNDWIELSEEVFQDMFRGSAVKRTKFAGLKRNIAAAR